MDRLPRGLSLNRRAALRALSVAPLALAVAGAPRVARAEPSRTPWPLWDAYVARFLSPDGRVIDDQDASTTSEAQAYAAFFALVAGDRGLFARTVQWTRDNLAGGCLGDRLPGWRWGRAPDGAWRLLDENAASDADLWLGYALLEGGRLWDDVAFDALGRSVLAHLVAREIATLPGLGPTLLPGPVGFHADPATWRLNPSYVPLQLAAGLASARVPGPWGAVRASAARIIEASAPRGVAADWLAWRAPRGFVVDQVAGAIGSYDAIRVPLWAGMLDRADPLRARMLARLGGLAAHRRRHGAVPERFDTRSGRAEGEGPPGFLAALLPAALGTDDAVAIDGALEARRSGALYGAAPRYYDQNLALFARGFAEGRFDFARDGRLRVAWRGAPPRRRAAG